MQPNREVYRVRRTLECPHSTGALTMSNDSSLPPSVSFTVELTDTEAWNLAQFLKRVGLSDFRSHAQDDAEAYAMRDAAEHLRMALAAAGYAPR
jgi:hypothetical protein